MPTVSESQAVLSEAERHFDDGSGGDDVPNCPSERVEGFESFPLERSRVLPRILFLSSLRMSERAPAS